MPETLRTVVLWNSSAGSAEGAEEVRHSLNAMGDVTIVEPVGRDAAIAEAALASRDGADLVIAAGGDGTVSSAVAGLMQADAEARPMLGILPMGTGNDLARTLGLPLVPTEALAALVSGVPRPLDVVQFTSSEGTGLYANMLTGGNTGRYVQHMTDEIKQRWGPLCYLRGVVDVIRDLEVFHLEMVCDDGRAETFEALNIFIANGRTSGGGMAVAPEAELDDGAVDVVIVRDGDAAEIAALTSQYLVADYLEHELIAFRRARQLNVAAQPGLPLTADGDEIGRTPLSVMVQPHALRVLVPQAIAAAVDGRGSPRRVS